MKKKIFSLIAGFILFFSVTYAYPSGNRIPASVSVMLMRDFTGAREISWESLDGFFKARFSDRGKTIYAFYTRDAELMGIASGILSDELPVALQTAIKANYSGYWISDLYDLNVNSNPGYLVTLENADQKIILKAEDNKTWSLYSMVKKD